MQENPYTNPSDEAYRLKRPEEKGYGLNAHTIIFEGLIPAFIGTFLITFSYVLFPAVIKGFQQGNMRHFSTNLSKGYGEKVAPLLEFDFSNTSVLWCILFGAILGITVKYFYSNEKPH